MNDHLKTNAELIKELESLRKLLAKEAPGERKQAEEALIKEQALLKTTLESTADGILVVAMDGSWSRFNQKFLDMWGIPKSISDDRNDQAALDYVIGMLTHPEEFIAKVQELYEDLESESLDTFELKDGRFFERFSMPQWLDKQVIGRVWSFRDITGHKQAEEALKESEARLAALADASREAIFFSEKGVCLDQNHAAKIMFGYSREEAIGKMGTDWIIPEHRELVMQNMLSGFEGPYEVDALRKDGSTFSVEIRAGLSRYMGRDVRTTALLDITERKQASRKLEEALKLQTVLYQIAEATNASKDLEAFCQSIQGYLGGILDTTNFFIALHEPEVGKLTFPYFTDEEDDPPGTVDFEKGMTEYVIRTGESLFATHDDIMRMHELGKIDLLGTPSKLWLGVPLLIDGSSVGAIVIQSYRDENLYTEESLKILSFVSTQIAEAMNRKQAEGELASERALLTTLMKNTDDNIYFKDLDSRFIMVSDSQAKLLNLSDPAQALGKSDFDFFSEDHARKTYAEEQEIIKTNKRLIGLQEHLILSGKPEMWVSTTKLPIQDENGLISGTFGITRDITQSKLAEEALAESNSMRELLLDIITHDLKNPVSVIYGLSEMARSDLPDNDLIESIYLSSERLLAVLGDTTILSQAAFGEDIPKQELVLSQLVKEIVGDFSSALATAEITVEIEIRSNIVIYANPLIGEVFKNYISNAIKYAPEGKRILIEAKTIDGMVVVSVKDFGQTLPIENRLNIFERKTQLSSARKSGRGLGLAIVKRIAAAHNGEAWVEPNTPVGNSFCLRVPLNGSSNQSNSRNLKTT